jgi:AcrR family transcriptional regulator
MVVQRRPYRSTLRQEQARTTRQAVVRAARDLFVERGWKGTTIDAVAERAGVSRKTVFTSVGGKPALIKVAWDWALAGDDAPVALEDRPVVRQLLAETNPRTVVGEWARLVCTIASRLAPLYGVLQNAAEADPEVAEVHATSERNRLRGARALVSHLDEIGGLRAGLDVDRATEAAAVLMDPMPYRRLVADAGWRFDDYVALVERMAAAALLADGA